jgi:hypothetical protein
MAWNRRALLAGAGCMLAVLGYARLVRAQAVRPPQTTDEALRQLADAAGVIFTGTVTAVHRIAPPTPGAAGSVQIDFAVGDAVRGITGATYSLREWAGLWEATDQPFRVGQIFLMLLHTPNASGLSSPVGGQDGAIPIHAADPAATAASQTLAGAASFTGTTSASAPSETVDLRWIATRVQTAVLYRTPARPIGSHTVVADKVSPEAVPASAAPSAGTQATTAASLAVPYSSVLLKLQAWEAARHAGS